ncbi:MAG: molybdopterin-binding protein [Burkholderiales bacterium]|nr:molybdopterin-binding protein [Burkholderiales bacterium]
MNEPDQRRRLLLGAAAGAGALLLGGCERVDSRVEGLLARASTLNRGVHKLLGGRRSMAQEFSVADLSPGFRGNGNVDPGDPAYRDLVAGGFAAWRLAVDGLVAQPASLSLAQLRLMPARTQITRHDCVEGWSAIGQWTGVPLARVLDLVRPLPRARFLVFHCADSFGSGESAAPYYESIDMDDAYHPQTILAYGLNGQALPVTNGAPLRLRVERQLGYKQAKYLMRIELVESYAAIRGGGGGYWEDHSGYAWYAGI